MSLRQNLIHELHGFYGINTCVLFVIRFKYTYYFFEIIPKAPIIYFLIRNKRYQSPVL